MLILNWRDPYSGEACGATEHLWQVLRRFNDDYRFTWLSCGPLGQARASYSLVPNVRVQRCGWSRTAPWCIAYGARRLLHRERVDLIVESVTHSPFFAPRFARSVPVVGIVHHLFEDRFRLEVGPVAARYLRYRERLIGTHFAHSNVVAVSASTKDALCRIGLTANLVHIIHNGLDHGLYAPGDATRIESGKIVVVARLKRYKSISHVLHALALLLRSGVRANLVIAGDGDQRGPLEQLTHNLGICHAVRFLGYVSNETKLRLLQSARITVQPSAIEGWGLSLLEANACGTPGVVANSPGLRDAVRPDTGLVYQYGDVRELAAALHRLIEDDQLYARLRRGAIAWARRFDWDCCHREYEDLFARILDRREHATVFESPHVGAAG